MNKSRIILFQVIAPCIVLLRSCKSKIVGNGTADTNAAVRERISLNRDWKFLKYEVAAMVDDLIYDVRPEVEDKEDVKPADARPTEAIKVQTNQKILKPWILPTGNDFVKDPAKRQERPGGNPGEDSPFVQVEFDDSSWETVNLTKA